MSLHADGLDPPDRSGDSDELTRLREEAEEQQEQGLWGEEALRANQAIVDLDPSDMAATTRLGRCVQGAGRACEALELFERVLASDPEDNVALELRGVAAADCELEREGRAILEERGLDGVREAAASAGRSVRDLRFAVLARQAVLEREPTA